MPDFLKVMARASLEQMRAAQAKESESELRRRAWDRQPAPRVVLSADGFDLIAEVKFRSPSGGALGDVDAPRDVAARAQAYARAGAAVISVLTEPSRFEGSLEDLEAAVRAVKIPVMRKDFLVDPYQALGSAGLRGGRCSSIVRMLEDARLAEMLQVATETGILHCSRRSTKRTWSERCESGGTASTGEPTGKQPGVNRQVNTQPCGDGRRGLDRHQHARPRDARGRAVATRPFGPAYSRGKDLGRGKRDRGDVRCRPRRPGGLLPRPRWDGIDARCGSGRACCVDRSRGA